MVFRWVRLRDSAAVDLNRYLNDDVRELWRTPPPCVYESA